MPLCNTHHDSVHRTGDEPAWWARQGIIDPLKIAARLWAASRQGGDGVEGETLPTSPDDVEPAATSPPPAWDGPAVTS